MTIQNRYIVTFVCLALSWVYSFAYDDPYGFCADVTSYEKEILNQYNLTPYIKNRIHDIVVEFVNDCEKDNPSDIAGTMFKNVAISRIKDIALKFHRNKSVDLLSNLQYAQWIDLGHPGEVGSAGNFLLRTDLGFNNHFDCIVMHEVTNGIALAQNPMRNIEGTRYILEEYSFYDDFKEFGFGKRFFVSSIGELLYVETLYDEDYLFNVNQFESSNPLFSKLVLALKNVNHLNL